MHLCKCSGVADLKHSLPMRVTTSILVGRSSLKNVVEDRGESHKLWSAGENLGDIFRDTRLWTGDQTGV